jgi:hypothetical protein
MNQQLRDLFMAFEENNEIVEEWLKLSEYLEPDTPEILEIKSLEYIEPEYCEYLGAIEYSIAQYYYENDRKVEDKDVSLSLKNIMLKYELDISFFIRDIEIQIINYLISPIMEKPITYHEFRLVINYVLWAIENRAWMKDKQAYVKWIAYVMGFYSEEEEKKYERDFKKHPDFTHLHFFMGVVHISIDPALAKSCFEKTLEIAEKVNLMTQSKTC